MPSLHRVTDIFWVQTKTFLRFFGNPEWKRKKKLDLPAFRSQQRDSVPETQQTRMLNSYNPCEFVDRTLWKEFLKNSGELVIHVQSEGWQRWPLWRHRVICLVSWPVHRNEASIDLAKSDFIMCQLKIWEQFSCTWVTLTTYKWEWTKLCSCWTGGVQVAKTTIIVMYQDFRSTKRALWLVDSWSRGPDQIQMYPDQDTIPQLLPAPNVLLRLLQV